MRTTFRRIFNVYPGEGRRTLLFALLGFVWSLAVNLGLQYAEALFLVNVGPQELPKVYMISALAMLLPAGFLFRAVNSYPAHKLFVIILSLLTGFYSCFYLLLVLGYGSNLWLWYLLRIVSFQLWVVMVTGYWTFTDQYHNMQDAKRLYVLFSSSVFAGLGLTGVTMRLGAFPFEQVILGVVLLALAALFLVRRISEKFHIAHEEIAIEKIESVRAHSLSSFVKELFSSRFALLIMASNFMIFLMWVTTEFNYLSAFSEIFGPETAPLSGAGVKAPLTLFLGKCVTAVSLTNLIFGLFFYSRLARRFGLASLLLFSPVLIVIAFLGWIRFELLGFMLLAYFVIEGSIEVIDDSNFNLLLNAVPRRLKYRVRIAIESFLEPMAMLIGGLLLSLPGIDSRYLALGAALSVLTIALLIPTRYHSAVYRILAENAIHFERKLSGWFHQMGGRERQRETSQLYQYLKSGDPGNALLAIEALLKLEKEPNIAQILERARSLPGVQKSHFLELLDKRELARNTQVAAQLQSWLDDNNEEPVKAKLLYLLAKHGFVHPDHLAGYMKSPNLKLRSAAILALKKGALQQPAKALAQNRKVADEAIKELLASEIEEEKTTALSLIGEELSTQQQQLLPYLDDPSPLVARHAMEAIAQTATLRDRHNAKTIIKKMCQSADPHFRSAALKALGKFDDPSLIRDLVIASLHLRQSEKHQLEELLMPMGKRAVPKLLAITKDLTIPHPCRALAVRVLGHTALPYLHANLHDLVTVEIERAYFYYAHKEHIQRHYPDLPLQLLVEAMQTGFHVVIEFIIRILSIAGEVEDAALLCRLYRRGDSKLRGQVVETLEKSCDRTIFNALRPLLEEHSPEVLLRQSLSTLGRCLPLEELLLAMSRSSSQVDQIVAATLFKQLQLDNWRAVISRQATQNRDPMFQHLAQELLDR